MTSPDTPPPAPRPPIRLDARLALLGSITALAALSVDMYLPALPAIARDLRVSDGAVAGTLAVFLAGFSVGQLVAGPLADRYGRRRPLLAGLLLYVLSSVACTFAPDIFTLTIARGVSAIAACTAIVCVRAVVRDLYDATDSARVMSTMMLVSGLAPILAPSAGSLVLAVAQWRWIFGLLTGVGLLMAWLAWRQLPNSQPHELRRSIAPRAVAIDYWYLLRQRDLLVPSLASGLSFGGMFAYISTTPALLIEGRQFGPTAFAVMFGVNAIGLVAAGQWNRRLVVRSGPRRVLTRGLLVQATVASLTFLAALALGGLPTPLLLAGLFGYVAMIGLVGGNATALAMANHGLRAGKAAALGGMIQFAVGSAGAALAGLLHDGTERPLLGVMAGAAALALGALRLLPPSPGEPPGPAPAGR